MRYPARVEVVVWPSAPLSHTFRFTSCMAWVHSRNSGPNQTNVAASLALIELSEYALTLDLFV